MSSGTSKVVLAVVATAFVALFLNENSTVQIESSHRRQLGLFDPRSVNEKPPPSITPSRNNGGNGVNDAGLEFVHISRTGGTAIEMAAWNSPAKTVWGVCHTSQGAYIGCDKPDWPHKFEWMGPSRQNNKFTGEPWLAPPKWLHPSPYLGDTFCIIRNPYDRIVSEYNGNSYSTFHSSDITSKDPRLLNDWIQMKLKEVMKLTNYPGHFLPQHFYVYDHHRKQAVTHVLRYENLQMEFHSLMRQYSLEFIQLPLNPPNEVAFTKASLSPDTIAMINNVYGTDFSVFGYPMVKRPSQFAHTAGESFAQIPTKLDRQIVSGEDMAQQEAAMVGVGLHQTGTAVQIKERPWEQPPATQGGETLSGRS